jgi:Zn finger protein HypA/HybF involved in hydrogenase expression
MRYSDHRPKGIEDGTSFFKETPHMKTIIDDELKAALARIKPVAERRKCPWCAAFFDVDGLDQKGCPECEAQAEITAAENL